MKFYGIDIAEGSDISNLTLASGTSFPANESVGEQFFRTDLDKMYVRKATEWGEAGSANKAVTYITPTAYNSMFLVLNNKLYTTSGNSVANGNYTTGRGLDNSVPFYGCNNFIEVSMPSASPIAKVGNGNGYEAAWALLANGELYTWGINSVGACGLGHLTQVAFPTLAETNVVDVYEHPSNASYSVAGARLIIKKTDGYLYGAGYNSNGHLGLGDTTNRNVFTQLTAFGNNILNVFNMGTWYGCLVVQKTDHTIWASGYNGYGQLGNGTPASIVSTPIDVTAAWGGGSGYILKQVVGGFGYYVSSAVSATTLGMLLDNGTTTVLKMCGYGTDSNLGNGSTANVSTPATPNIGAGRINKVAFIGALGPVQVLKEDNNLYTWGRNNEGGLANGTTITTTTPFLTESNVIDLYCDGWNSHQSGYFIPIFIKKTDNQVYMVGHNGAGGAYGGIGSQAVNVSAFARVMLPYNLDVQMMGSFCTSTSGRIVLAVGNDGKVYVWGYGTHFGVMSTNSSHCDYPSQIQITEDNN